MFHNDERKVIALERMLKKNKIKSLCASEGNWPDGSTADSIRSET